jgi:hypothetical protein
VGIFSRRGAQLADKPRSWKVGAALISGGMLAVQVGAAILDREYDTAAGQLAELQAVLYPARGAHAAGSPHLAVVDDPPADLPREPSEYSSAGTGVGGQADNPGGSDGAA